MHSRSIVFAILPCAVFFLGMVPAFARPLACQKPTPPGTHYANRPIVLTGAKKLLNKKIDLIKAFAFKNDKFVRVNIQIDERNERGDFVLERGMPFTANTGNGLFDENDDFVFMAHSLGDVFEKSDLSDYLANYHAIEILHVCINNSVLGSLAIVVSEGEKNPKINATPVDFIKATNTIRSASYTYHFNPKHAAIMGDLLVGQKNGELKKIIKGSNFQMAVNPAWFLPYVILDHNDFSSSIESWRQGPVRTIVAVGVKYVGLFSLLNLHLFSELVFYENSFSIPTVIEFVFSPKTFLSRGSGLNFGLNFENPEDWKIETDLPKIPQGGRQIEAYYAGKAIEFGALTARLLSRDDIIQIGVRVDREAAKLVPPPMVFGRGDLKANKSSNDWPGLASVDADIAVFLDISNVSAETYDFGLDLYLQKNDKNHAISDPRNYTFHWN